MSENTITVYDKLELDIISLESMNASMKFDLETSDGELECRAHLKKLRKVWNGIERLRKDAKADFIAKGKEVDVEAKSFQSRVDAMHQLHSDPLREKEVKEQLKIEAIAAANKLKGEIEDAEREAYLEKGERKLEADEKALQDKADELKAEEDRIKNEQRIADAAKQATIDAEAKAASDKIEAAEEAKRVTAAAVAKTEREAKAAADKIITDHAKAEADRIKIEEDAAETKRQFKAAELKRSNDKKHREEVEAAITVELGRFISDEGAILELMDDIRSGKIPNLEIQY